MKYEKYEEFSAEEHRKTIQHYNSRRHLATIDKLEIAIAKLLKDIKKYKKEEKYDQAVIWTSYLKATDRKLANHYLELLHLKERMPGDLHSAVDYEE